MCFDAAKDPAGKAAFARKQFGAAAMAGDLKALEGKRWDVCIDNPTMLPFWVRDAGRVLQGRVDQYIFISTVSVYADSDKPEDEFAKLAPYEGADPMAETMQTVRPRVNELYGPLKAVSEQEAARQFPGAATIIRPGLWATSSIQNSLPGVFTGALAILKSSAPSALVRM